MTFLIPVFLLMFFAKHDTSEVIHCPMWRINIPTTMVNHQAKGQPLR